MAGGQQLLRADRETDGPLLESTRADVERTALGAVDVDVLDTGGDGGMDDPSNAEGLGGLLMKLPS